MGERDICSFVDLHKKHHFYQFESQFTTLWHYTTANGFLGIVGDSGKKKKSLHFWFTRSDCLNDISEGNHILTVYKELCDDLFNQGSIDELFYQSIKNIEIPDDQFIDYPCPTNEENCHESMLDCVPCDSFVCCFSLKEDSLDMWRYYSKGDGGYGLGFINCLFESYTAADTFEFDENKVFSCMNSFRVIYKMKEKQRILRELIIDTYSAYKNSIGTQQEKINNSQCFIRYALKIYQFQFKHECFASEEEYRFVYYLPKKAPEKLKQKLPTVHYRTQNGMIIPYIDIEIEEKDIHMLDVLISPFIENEAVLSTTDDYLKKCGFKCKPRLSQLPVRK